MDSARKRFFVIFDLEATCWENDPAKTGESEIIEIGAVKAAPNPLTIVVEFNAFIRPARHPRLSSFCMELTSISQDDVDGVRNIFRILKKMRMDTI